ncbi:MAG: dinitrogenase iron-molybdenum cofactor [Clostridia bacterium]|nr:dinitrogenase iron-molybdenum cofactor [Clostridia bacterium]
MVTEHFGHCQNFNIYDIENGKILKVESIPNPGHKPGFLPFFLYDLGINIIMSGGIGGGAIEIFNEKNIEVVTGATGEATKTVEMFLTNELKSTNSVCNQHKHGC